MSQISRKKNVGAVEAISIAEASFSLLGAAISLTAKAGAFAVGEIIKGVSTNKIDNKTNTTALSPAQLRELYNEGYKRNLQEIQRGGIKPIEAAKASVIKTLTEIPFATVNSAAINEKLSALVSSNHSTLQSSFSKLITEVENQHKIVFTKALVETVSKASVASGFKEVRIIENGATPQIIAKDDRGRGLITEVIVNQNNVIDISTETKGISDGSCGQIMEKFNLELEKLGVKYSQDNTKWTGGACIIPADNINLGVSATKHNNRTAKLTNVSKVKS